MQKAVHRGSLEALLLLIAVITLLGYQAYAFSGFGNATNGNWSNISWHYRMRVEINSTAVNRTNWPVELAVNFTDLMPSGTFDINSTRVYEYNAAGNIFYEVPSQFDIGAGYNASSNAAGTIIFIMNSTTAANEKRIFYVYYDITENGAKQAPSYATRLIQTWDGRLANVSNALLNISIDTNRNQNTSGIARAAENQFQNVILQAAAGARTAEYVEYTNTTHNLSFNLINSTVMINGSVRTTVMQAGQEIIFGDTNAPTGTLNVTKTYHFYNISGPSVQGMFIKLVVNITNTGASTVNRNSTPAGAIAIDADRALSSASIDTFDFSSTDPASYAWASGIGGELVGIVNANESVQNFSAAYAATLGRIGINLSETSIGPGSSVQHTAVLYFGTGGSDAVTEFLLVRDGFASPLLITQFQPEQWNVTAQPLLVPAVYNRNESVLVRANLSLFYDPYNLTVFVNATIDNGTQAADDTTVQLFDDGTNGDAAAGDNIFSRNYSLSVNSNATAWSVNYTAYDASGNLLGSNIGVFNVTDVLNVTTSVINPNGLVSRQVFADVVVKNFRTDVLLEAASVGCSVGSTPVTNITDLGNGTYSVNFTAPSTQGSFFLACNATKMGNFGNGTDLFLTEIDRTVVSVRVEPQTTNATNVTLAGNVTFGVNINLTNLDQGTATNVNITLQVLTGWSYEPATITCSSVEIGSTCARLANVTVPAATAPGSYHFNVTINWTNPGGSTDINTTFGNVTVLENPVVNVSEKNITATVGDGATNQIGNFSVLSIGNNLTNNVTFTCVSGTACQNFTVLFNPPNVTGIAAGSNATVRVNVTVPIGFPAGTYNGTVNVTGDGASTGTLLLFLTVPPKTNLTVQLIPPSYLATNVTLFTSEIFQLLVNATNAANASARSTNISLTVPTGWSYSPPTAQCGNITAGQYCERQFNVTVANGTQPGNYTVNATVSWTNVDDTAGSANSSMVVEVGASSTIDVVPTTISANVSGGAEINIGNFTIFSLGNNPSTNVSIGCVSGVVCQNFSVELDPSFISSIGQGSNATVRVNITVPSTFLAGLYSGTVNVSSSNVTKTVTLAVTVLDNRVWSMTPQSCTRSQNPSEGTACTVIISNTGNTEINFTVTPSAANNSMFNETNFTVPANTNKTLSVLYNVTGQPIATYNASFAVTANQTATPQSLQFNVSLLPYTPPLIVLTLNATTVSQNSTVTITANITDVASLGIALVRANITLPNGTMISANLSLASQSGNLSQWTLSYPNQTFGTTAERGVYNITLLAEDSIGNSNFTTASFKTHVSLSVTALTLSSTYFQGDTGSIFYVARDLSGAGVQNVSVNLKIKDSTGNTTYTSTSVTDQDGLITPLPSFSLAADTPTGNYSLTANSSYFDPFVNITVNRTVNSTFVVNSRTVTVAGLFADIETAVVWFPNNVMRFNALIYDGQGTPVDPTTLNLTVLDPAGNVYFTVSNLSQFTKQQTGFYTYTFAMPVSTATGMYLAVLGVSQGSFDTLKLKAFRVASGGPYDVRVNLVDTQASPGDFLDFILVIENKGEVSQDVFVDYAVESTSGQQYYTASEAVFTPAFSNQSFNRNAAIFTTQPLGTYVLKVNVRYDTVQPTVNASASFIVVASSVTPPPTTPPPSTGGGGGTTVVTGAVTEIEDRAVQRSILISRYSSNVSLARGFTRIDQVTVTNTGKKILNNVTLVVLGVPTSWYKVSPVSYNSLDVVNSSVFIIEYTIPDDAELGPMAASLLATGGTVGDQKQITINVFRSLEELLAAEIDRIEDEYADLLIEIRVAEREGKDVSTAKTISEEIDEKIKSAKDKFDSEDYEDVYEDLDTARDLIQKSYDVLDSLSVVQVEGVSFLMVPLVFIIILSSFFGLFYAKHRKLPFTLPTHMPKHVPRIRVPHMIFARKQQPQQSQQNQGTEEIDKLLRMLNVLESEKREGLITNHAYEEMKRSVEYKLARLKKGK